MRNSLKLARTRQKKKKKNALPVAVIIIELKGAFHRIKNCGGGGLKRNLRRDSNGMMACQGPLPSSRLVDEWTSESRNRQGVS